MKVLIHCDEVFDILTRGPFPSGSEHDAAVEHHLRCCHDCRQLAEALRPAVALFHESLSADEVDSLPEYLGEATPLERPQTRRLPRAISEIRLPPEIAPRERHSLVSRRALLVQGFVGLTLTAAVVLLVVSFGNSLGQLRQPTGFSGGTGKAEFRPIASQQDAARHLLALKLPAACWLGTELQANAPGSFELQLAAALEQREIACCTRCHAENQSRSLSGQQIARLQQSCRACHEG